MPIVEDQLLAPNDTVIQFNDYRGLTHSFRPRAGEPILWATITPPLTGLNSICEAPAGILDQTVALPFLVDTGCTESVVMHNYHFKKWLYVDVSNDQRYEPLSEIIMNGLPCQRTIATCWIFRTSGFDQPNIREVESERMDIRGCVVSRIDSGSDFTNSLEANENVRPQPQKGMFRKLKYAVANYSSGSKANRRSKRRDRDATKYVEQKEYAFPRVPLIGMKLLRSNKLDFQLRCSGDKKSFTLSR